MKPVPQDLKARVADINAALARATKSPTSANNRTAWDELRDLALYIFESELQADETT